MVKDKGKYLEGKVQEYFRIKNIWLLRLYDTRSAGKFLPASPSDFIILKNPMEFLECKELNGTLLSISAFRAAQLKAMKRAQEKGIKYNIIILVNKKNYCLLSSSDILDTIIMGKKSIQLKDMIFSRSIDALYK